MKYLILVSFLMCFVSCSSDNDDSSELGQVSGDLVFMNGSSTFGLGIASSLEANEFIQCQSSLSKINNFLPKKLLIAFGIGTQTTCGVCAVRYLCEPGVVMSITTYHHQGNVIAAPDAFENEPGGFSDGPTSFPCPPSGEFTAAQSSAGSDYVRFVFENNGVTDTEYLRCN